MALEKSILTNESITRLLKENYGIEVASIEKLRLGSANCYRISDRSQNYFLKEFQCGFSGDDLTREAQIVNFLSERSIPVARFFLTKTGTPYIIFQEHLICLEEYISGNTSDYDNFPKALLPEAAQMLGRLHLALQNYPLAAEMGRAWLDSYSAEVLISQYDKLLTLARQRTANSITSRIISDLEYKKELAWRCDKYKEAYTGVTYCPTHGDYQGCQLVFDDQHIKAVIDFSSARSLPVVWEIMRSYVQSSQICRETAVIDIAEFCKYVREYLKFSPLSQTDLQAMPYVYLFQLARSKYGYKQYLEMESEDNWRLLQFAFWRTNMCREVESKANAISKALSELRTITK